MNKISQVKIMEAVASLTNATIQANFLSGAAEGALNVLQLLEGATVLKNEAENNYPTMWVSLEKLKVLMRETQNILL